VVIVHGNACFSNFVSYSRNSRHKCSFYPALKYCFLEKMIIIYQMLAIIIYFFILCKFSRSLSTIFYLLSKIIVINH